MSKNGIQVLANEALEAFERVETLAHEQLENTSQRDLSSSLAVLQSLTGNAALHNLESITDRKARDLLALMRMPSIARVAVEDSDGQTDIYYISRTTSIAVPGIKLASYRSDLGRLASLDIGDEEEFAIGNRRVWLRVLERLELRPYKDQHAWDSTPSVWHRESEVPLTIRSLRATIGPAANDGGFMAFLASGEADRNVVEGLTHQIRTAMALRDQAVLDKFQDEIFRLPLARQLIILGPPGTGKTTTLIKRLGQKLALESSADGEGRGESFSGRWVMFTPSELLKHYLKEAFGREGIAAPDDRIKTWSKRRHELARQVFGILKTTSGGTLILKEERQHLPSAVVQDPRVWFDQFRAFHQQRVVEALRQGMTTLQEVSPAHADELVQRLARLLPALDGGQLLSVYSELHDLEDVLAPLLEESRKKTDLWIDGEGGALFRQNKSVFNELATFLDSLNQPDEEEDEENEFDDDGVEEAVQRQSGNAAHEAFQAYRRFLQSYARSRFKGRRPGKASRAARILEWLGDRLPGDERIKELGEEMTLQNALRRYRNAWKRYVLDVPASYRAFRRQCLSQSSFEYQRPESPAHIDATELDAILLMMLRSARELMLQRFVQRRFDEAKFAELQRVAGLLQQQVLVDEATDFSVLQLACMEALTDLKTRSFFACGDFNQRVTGYGLRSRDQLEWISAKLEASSINTVYRQSRKLNGFALELLTLMDGDLSAQAQLPEHSNHEGVPPVLGEQLRGQDIPPWLSARIKEIERMVKDMPSIAVLVPSEDQVKPMAEALNRQLETISMRAVACVDGQVLGDEGDIRVFDLQHIKGLEFEAVFFVGVDALAETKPEIFDRFVYVGATRAATYLGMVCEGSLPERLHPLRTLFVPKWG
ncbi:DNA polymerase III delta prime subunit [Paraburkholderia sp. WC7.3g]|uniref:ATP-binding domain-containing protein n=1 Tax=Paraburkholderia sp. WC7.3g TaxID=2991070 RepID=UPI003D1FAC68